MASYSMKEALRRHRDAVNRAEEHSAKEPRPSGARGHYSEAIRLWRFAQKTALYAMKVDDALVAQRRVAHFQQLLLRTAFPDPIRDRNGEVRCKTPTPVPAGGRGKLFVRGGGAC